MRERKPGRHGLKQPRGRSVTSTMHPAAQPCIKDGNSYHGEDGPGCLVLGKSEGGVDLGCPRWRGTRDARGRQGQCIANTGRRRETTDGRAAPKSQPYVGAKGRVEAQVRASHRCAITTKAKQPVRKRVEGSAGTPESSTRCSCRRRTGAATRRRRRGGDKSGGVKKKQGGRRRPRKPAGAE
jgi:hypothetical protein